MGETSLSSHVDQQNTGKRKWSIIGPGLIVAATGVGAGDLVAALVAGSRYGLVFLWAIIIGAVIKFTLNEGVGRWHVTSGKTILEGWRSIGPWATGYFGIYTLIWGFVYGAAGMSSCALAMTTMFPVIPLWAWAIIHGLVGFILIWSGKYKMFENVMTLLVGLMFITVVGSALLVIPDLGHIMNTASPSLPKGSLIYALGLIGGVGGSITMASYGYWLSEKRWNDRSYVSVMRGDSASAYIITSIFTVSLLILGAALLYGSGTVIDGQAGLVKFSSILSHDLHPAVRWLVFNRILGSIVYFLAGCMERCFLSLCRFRQDGSKIECA